MSTLRRYSVYLLVGGLSMTAHADESGFDDDYGRSEVWDNQGQVFWESLLKDDELEGWEGQTDPPIWSREANTVVVTAPDRNVWPKLLYGSNAWESYELKVRATLVQGSNLYISFRESDEGHYQFGFLPGAQAMAIARKGPDGLTKLDVVNYVVERGKEYDISIAVRHHSMTSYVDGELVLRPGNICTKKL